MAVLGEVFERFVEKSPISVMVRGMLERVLGADQLDQWYANTAEKQYTRTLLFSTVYDLLSQVVFCLKPSVHAAYQEKEEEVGTSIVAVYDKLNVRFVDPKPNPKQVWGKGPEPKRRNNLWLENLILV